MVARVTPVEAYELRPTASVTNGPRLVIGAAGAFERGVSDSGFISQSSTDVVHKTSSLTYSPHYRSHEQRRSTSWTHRVREQVRGFSVRVGWYDSVVACAVRKFLYGRFFSLVAMIALFVALFFADLFVLSQVPSNTELDIILTGCFIVFGFEFIGLSLTDASYLLGFFFWMDLVGTLSMVMDISYMIGTDATMPHRVHVGDVDGTGTENMIVVRAARAAKLGARAGRLSRVLRLFRFIPFLNAKETRDVKMARVISNQLTNVLSTRVAFLCIAIVVLLPVFTLFTYPVVDDSMGAWTRLLGRNAEACYHALETGDPALQQEARSLLEAEMKRLADFYKDKTYGPFDVCYGEHVGGEFRCRPDLLDLSFDATFRSPTRKQSIREVSEAKIRLSFDMSTPKQHEAAAGMGVICFVVLVMCTFGLVMSNSIGIIALQPLERMLSVVRHRCKQIFKYAKDLQEDEEDTGEKDEDYDDTEHDSEFMLLERVVDKLAAIANLSSTNEQPEVKADMTEDEVMKLNWIQGAAINQPVKSKTHASLDGKEADHAVPLPRSSRMKLLTSNLPATVLESLETDEFNPLELNQEQSISAAIYMMMFAEGVSEGARSLFQDNQLVNFVTAVESKYLPNPFHNFAHGVDVLASVVNFMHRTDAQAFFPEACQFWLMIAAIGHDIGHLGVNNQFLVETTHELALKYNDRSPMENMHCATLFQVTSNPDTNVFLHVEKALYKEMRTGIITAVLHTDMMKHGDMIKDLGLLYQMNSEAFDDLNPGSVVSGSQAHLQLVLNALLHCSDIANPMKPWEICREYANRCLDEFFAQGDKEKEAGIPVQMLNDREKVNRANSQVGFIEFVIAPICVAVVNIFPQLDHLADHLGRNIQNWCDIWVEKSSPPADAAGKVIARVQKVTGRCEALMRSAREEDF